MLSHLQPAYVVFMILVFAAAATGFQAFAGLARVASVKRRVNRRLTLAEQSGSLPELVFELRRRGHIGAHFAPLLRRRHP